MNALEERLKKDIEKKIIFLRKKESINVDVNWLIRWCIFRLHIVNHTNKYDEIITELKNYHGLACDSIDKRRILTKVKNFIQYG